MTIRLNGVKLQDRKEAGNLSYTYNKLKGRIVEKYGSQEKFAKQIGMSKVSVSKKLNGITGFSQSDIEVWAHKLEITRDKYSEYFFA